MRTLSASRCTVINAHISTLIGAFQGLSSGLLAWLAITSAVLQLDPTALSVRATRPALPVASIRQALSSIGSPSRNNKFDIVIIVITLISIVLNPVVFMSMKAENLSVRLPLEVKLQVDAIARRTRRSRSFVINEAVISYVQAQADYAREVTDAVKSADSGVGHSKEQVFTWLDSWVDGNKTPLPSPDIFPDD